MFTQQRVAPGTWSRMSIDENRVGVRGRAARALQLTTGGSKVEPMVDQTEAGFVELQQALAGRYSIERELGRGGMGIVYLAREVSLDRPVALKLLPPALAGQAATRERFLQEARTAAKLSHPNIVPIFAVDEVDDFVFFAMAYIEGETLGERVRSRGPRAASEVARILREVSWALAYAHAQGVVHRDVKPDNILLEEGSGRALVADFGIASVAESAGGRADRVAGTAEFMSPEQARGGPVGASSDIYSLGIVGFYALAGSLPFEGSTAPAILGKHLSEPAPALVSVAPGVPTQLARTIDRCLAKEPENRFPNEEELAETLGQLVEQRRDVPAPLRSFIKRTGDIGTGGILLYFFLLFSASGTVASLLGSAVGYGLGTTIGYGVFFGGLSLAPLGITVNRVRRLLKSGFGREELLVAFRAEIERNREEGSFEYGHEPSKYEWSLRVLSVGGIVTAAVSLIAMFNSPSETLALTFSFGLLTGLGTGVPALTRIQKRHDLDGRLRSWLWRSRFGRWMFRLAGLGLKRLPQAGSATYRPTEIAIGLAADRLYDQLPRAARRSLRQLPDVVRKLENDAQRMRRRVDELTEVLGGLRADKRQSRSLQAALPESDVTERQQQLEDDLAAARDAAQDRLADAVAALETIRLGLLHMHAGGGSVESLTGDLEAAREVADDIDRLMDAQREVQKLIDG